MNNKEIRTKYIKSLVSDTNNLASILKESTNESLSSLLDESVSRNMRRMIAESFDNSYEEEEVDPNESEFDENPEENDVDININNEEDVDTNINNEEEADQNSFEQPEEGQENEEGEEANEEENVWDGMSDYQDADGEYDLRGMDINKVLEILQNMDPNDGVRIVKNDDNTATVEPEGEGEEFTINIEDDETESDDFDFEGENEDFDQDNDFDFNDETMGEIDSISIDDDGEEESDDDVVFEIETEEDNDEDNNEEEMLNERNTNLGYTTNYQKKTAMTMPHDKGAGEGDSRFDAGAPTGDGKRWVGKKGANGGNPYTKSVNENETIFEVELNDEQEMCEGASTITRNNAYTNSVGRKQVHNPEQDDKVRNSHREGGVKRGTGYGRGNTSESRMRAIERQATAIMNENKELRSIAQDIKKKLEEAVVINSSLAKVIKLVTENSTTRDEKINILNRFNEVRTLNESRNLYKQISNELSNSNNTLKNSNLIATPITEAKSQNNNMIVETNLLNTSSDLQNILDLNKRLMNL
jgi:hypothetical protein